MIMPWGRLKLQKRNRLCLGTMMKSKGFKRDRRKAERQWLQHRGDPTKNVTCREEYRLMCNRYRSAINEAKAEYYSGKVQECAGDQKKLFKIIKFLTKSLQQEQCLDSRVIERSGGCIWRFLYNEDSENQNKIGQSGS